MKENILLTNYKGLSQEELEKLPAKELARIAYEALQNWDKLNQKVNQDSTNSNQAPSTDSPEAKARQKAEKEATQETTSKKHGARKQGAQQGHEAVNRPLLQLGKAAYPAATELTITADCGGSNGNRRRLWKTELQKFADETGMILRILHYPPGTSKWNKIEHRMFSFISKNWRGKPLVSLEVIVNLISSTTTNAGLKINCAIDRTSYPTGQKVTDDELDSVNLVRDSYHGEWNYRIFPRVFDNVID